MSFAERAAEAILKRMSERYLKYKKEIGVSSELESLITELEIEDIINREWAADVQISITGATVLLSETADKVLLNTNLPCPFVAEFLPQQQPLQLDFEATYNTGIDYCRQILHIEPEVINIRR